MKTKLSATFILCAALTMMTGCVETEPTEGPNENRVYRIDTVLDSSHPVRDAKVTIRANDDEFVGYTDDSGRCRIEIPNDVSLPRYVVGTIDHNGIMPEAFSFPGHRNASYKRTTNCVRLTKTPRVRSSTLRHLGDDSYGGSENSQLQIPTEGLRRSYAFHQDQSPGRMPWLRLYARGVQCKPKVLINGVVVARLADSKPNGDISLYQFQLHGSPRNVIHGGTNVLTIETDVCNAPDKDDFEYCSLLLYYP